MHYKGENRKSIISQKLRIVQKKSFVQIMIVISIPILIEKLVTFEENLILRRPKRPFWTPIAPKRDMMWYKILDPSIFSAHCASFMPRWPLLSRGGEGSLHILSLKTSYIHICIYIYIYTYISCKHSISNKLKQFNGSKLVYWS